MNKIKFSHKYYKMPSAYQKSQLAQVIPLEESEISDSFREYDTAYSRGMNCIEEHYPLPKEKLLLLLLIANEGKGWLWCTIRRWTPKKEGYYKAMCGEVFECVIEGDTP